MPVRRAAQGLAQLQYLARMHGLALLSRPSVHREACDQHRGRSVLTSRHKRALAISNLREAADSVQLKQPIAVGGRSCMIASLFMS
eukprot:scaffold2144_cov334-Prasinococcus_capsulatus_cf.AAC.13